MLKLFIIGTSLAVSIAGTAFDRLIKTAFQSGTPSQLDKQLTLRHTPSLGMPVTLPGFVSYTALYLASNLISREFQQKKSKIKTTKNLKKKNNINVATRSLTQLDQNIAKRMQNKLLCYQDRDLAYWMVLRAKNESPNISEQWYWDKVVYDLNRDRR